MAQRKRKKGYGPQEGLSYAMQASNLVCEISHWEKATVERYELVAIKA